MTNELHQEIKQKAEELGMSVNGYINHILMKSETEDRLNDHERRILELESKLNQEKK